MKKIIEMIRNLFKPRIKLFKNYEGSEGLVCYLNAGLERKGKLIALCEKSYVDYELKAVKHDCLFSSLEDFKRYMLKSEIPYLEESSFIHGVSKKEIERVNKKLEDEKCNPEMITLHYSSVISEQVRYDYVLYAELVDVVGK